MLGNCGKTPKTSTLPCFAQIAEFSDSDLKKLSVAQNLDYLFALDCEDGRCVQRAENSGEFE